MTTKQKIAEILASGMPQTKLAKAINCDQSTISRVANSPYDDGDWRARLDAFYLKWKKSKKQSA